MRTILTDIKSIIITEVTFILLIQCYTFMYRVMLCRHIIMKGLITGHIVHAKQQARDNE